MAKGEIDVKIEVVESELEKQRRQFWIDVYLQCMKEGYVINFADAALDRFDERFNTPKQPQS